MLSGLECEYRQACLSRRDHPRSRFRCYGRCSGGREHPPRFLDGRDRLRHPSVYHHYSVRF